MHKQLEIPVYNMYFFSIISVFLMCIFLQYSEKKYTVFTVITYVIKGYTGTTVFSENSQSLP